MASSIHLFRHGETAWSLAGRHTGRTDLPLTAEGEHRAALLRGRPGGVAFDHVFTSPRLRARRTCELAGLAGGARTEPDLQEWDYGAYEGRTTEDIHRQRPGWDVFHDGCPEGESVDQIVLRAGRVLALLRSTPGAVALFSHGHFLRALAMCWLGLPVSDGRKFVLDPGAMSILGFEAPDGDVPAVKLWNGGAPAPLPPE